MILPLLHWKLHLVGRSFEARVSGSPVDHSLYPDIRDNLPLYTPVSLSAERTDLLTSLPPLPESIAPRSLQQWNMAAVLEYWSIVNWSSSKLSHVTFKQPLLPHINSLAKNSSVSKESLSRDDAVDCNERCDWPITRYHHCICTKLRLNVWLARPFLWPVAAAPKHTSSQEFGHLKPTFSCFSHV